jgi:modification methylase
MDTTSHKIFTHDSRYLSEIIQPNSIDLVITSPPYPMISMWDELFFILNSDIKNVMHNEPKLAFELMNAELDKVWTALFGCIKDGGFLIINIGDATRTVQSDFQLYSNHSRIVSKCLELGFKNLPNILWRKQTNAPNKFMGSGMLPAGAYVTLEHEYILIFRKGNKRIFTEEQKKLRNESGYFWEERNVWFSDIWEDVKGTKQSLSIKEARERSAAYPFELAYRLINMYSNKGDFILDPFFGTGTTTLAAIASERNSFGVELENSLKQNFYHNVVSMQDKLNEYILNRIRKHKDFVTNCLALNKEIKHHNNTMSVPVVTGQEKEIILRKVESIQIQDDTIKVNYSKIENDIEQSASLKKQKN